VGCGIEGNEDSRGIRLCEEKHYPQLIGFRKLKIGIIFESVHYNIGTVYPFST
jgi:hypothetical protein